VRTITVRQLSVNLFKELEDLPVTVTRYGKRLCVIVPQDTVKDPPEIILKRLPKTFVRKRGEMNLDDYL
jgi:hypothetical protein